MRARSVRGLLATVVVAMVVVGVASCGGHEQGHDREPPPTVAKPGDHAGGLELRVSNGKQGVAAVDHATLAPATRLADADVQALLARGKPIAADPTDVQAFALRPASTPVPRTGQTITASFPPPPSSLLPPPAATTGTELAVARWMPEGKVPLAPQLSITFSQPMVAVTSQADAAATVPVKLTPTPPGGKWRWIGTRTIVFDPDVRFPQATTYHVEVPAGTKSVAGGTLTTAATFSFETPAPTLASHYPDDNEPRRLDVPMLLVFDQKIDPRAVLATIHVHAHGGPALPLRLLDAAEIAKDKPFAELVAQTKTDDQDGRWLAFRTTQPLPSDTTIDVEIAAGTASAEGPNKTTDVQTFSFRTYPPLKIVKVECGWSSACRPRLPFQIELNNPVDADKLDRTVIQVEPAVADLQIVANGHRISLEGTTQPRTTYQVTIRGALVDAFGQKLGADDTRPWSVEDAEPTMFGVRDLEVLDPAATKPALDLFTTNYDHLRVRLYQVQPADYTAYVHFTANQWEQDKPTPAPGKQVVDQVIATGNAAPASGLGMLAETSIDLSAALPTSGLGHVIAIVEPSPWTGEGLPPRVVTWVQSTKLAVDVAIDGDSLHAFATELGTATPAAGVDIEIRPYGITAKTDGTGMATLPLAPPASRSLLGERVVLARRGDDVAFVGAQGHYFYDDDAGSWARVVKPPRLAWYVIDDRKMYKPGETVSVKGWLRTIDDGKHGDITGVTGLVTAVTYTVMDSSSKQIAAGTAPVNAIGGFDLKLALPATPNLGGARISFQTVGKLVDKFEHRFEIQEFRRPEFEVSAQASQGPFVVGGAGDVTVNASYLSGGPLAGAPVRWTVVASPTNFTPPNRDDYEFGNWRPWWDESSSRDSDSDSDDAAASPRDDRAHDWRLTSKTDATGAHVLHLDFDAMTPAMPMSIAAHAVVTDVNRQAWAASAALVVHPSSLYVGLKPKKPYVEAGTPFDLDVIGVDLDGHAVAGAKIDITAERLEWEFKKGRYRTKRVDPQTCTVVSAADAMACHFATAKGGTYQLTATIVDDKGRANQTSAEFWVSGGDSPPARGVTEQTVGLIPDKKTYAVGNTAELLIQAPFAPAEGVVSWRRSGIVKSERITLTTGSKVITVPIDDSMVPNMTVQVDLVGMTTRNDDKGVPDPKLPRRPAYASGSIALPVPPTSRTLAVSVTPSVAKLAPGAQATLAVDVKDAAGQPVANAEVAVIVVDEAILGLSSYVFPTPIDRFYQSRDPGAHDYHSREYVALARIEAGKAATVPPGVDIPDPHTGGGGMAMALDEIKMGKGEGDLVQGQYKMSRSDESPELARMQAIEQARSAGILGSNAGSPANAAIAIRANFDPLAVFAPTVTTGADGHAVVDVKMPDNLTRYRVVAIAAAGDRQFGKGENAMTVRLPLMVRPSPPRFLNFGDTFQLPVVIQNQTDAAVHVKVAIRATNATLTDGAGREVSVPANDRVEVRFPAAAELAGTARFQILGTSGDSSDAAEVALPVWTPATTEAFATYGVIDDGTIKQRVALPGQVVTQFGGLDVTTTSTNLGALTDALLYLVHYPFECAEQRSSRLLAIATLRDVLVAFKTQDMPSAAQMEHSVDADIEHLSQMQNRDGGYAFWERGERTEPFLAIYVTDALAHAKAKGFAVPQKMLDKALPYLRDIESHYPDYYPPEIQWAMSAYALYTRKELGDLDIKKGKELLATAGGVDKVTMETDGWLLDLFAQNPGAADERKQLVRYALDHVSETAGAANFTTDYGDFNYLILGSDRRVDAVMLEALIHEQPTLELIPKVVTGLLAQRKAGRWQSTQENSFILRALDLYFRTYEKLTPDFVARVWLGDDYAGDHAFKGRTTEHDEIVIPMTAVASHDQQDLTIQKDGKGRLYYRIGMTYAPTSLKLEAADYGFVVERTYVGADDPKDVTRGADGTWHVKAGARVRVKLSMVNQNRRYHVALVDPMPAGFEALNPALAVTAEIPQDPASQRTKGSYGWWYGAWYEHQNMRDDRVEAFTSMLWEGVHDYSWVARATTPGNFVVPPPKAEEMYMPETFGRGASDRVIVEP